MNYLYHYCNNVKCFNIIQSETIRLYDIGKSNDYGELKMFYPEIFSCLREYYFKAPFPFNYNGKKNEDAFIELLDGVQHIWEERFYTGEFSSFVICFSEESDLLSQWRGYSDDGRGCCIGFSHEILQNFCKESGNVLRLEKIEYLTEEQINYKLEKVVIEILDILKTLRQWIVDNMTYNDKDDNTDGLLSFNFSGMLENFFIDSLRYKAIGFKEEKEWRLFINNYAYKNPEWVCGSIDEIEYGSNGFKETIDFLKNKIEFTITSDDLIPYLPLDFNESKNNIFEELRIGPKNKIRESDIKLFMAMNGYNEINITYSNISYR